MEIHLLFCTTDHPDFVALIGELDRDLAVRDGLEHSFYQQFNKPDPMMEAVVVYGDGQPAACGALRNFDADSTEVKRMYVRPEHRRKGLAVYVLNALEDRARIKGRKRCILETGLRQPEAIALYTKSGYVRIPNYGPYAGVDNSCCFEKHL